MFSEIGAFCSGYGAWVIEKECTVFLGPWNVVVLTLIHVAGQKRLSQSYIFRLCAEVNEQTERRPEILPKQVNRYLLSSQMSLFAFMQRVTERPSNSRAFSTNIWETLQGLGNDRNYVMLICGCSFQIE